MGAGFASDAFLVAFRLPNMFRALFAEGAFAAAFIPLFNEKASEADENRAAFAFAENALAVLFPVLLVLTIILIAAAWPLTWALSGGFQSGGYDPPTPDQFAFAVSLSRITIPYLMLISLTALMGGILNSLDKYWVNAAAPMLLNLSMIGGMWFFHGDPAETARVQAWSVTIGGVLQFLWLTLACRRVGVKLRLKPPKIDKDVKRLLLLILPAAAGAGAVQINTAISQALAGGMLPHGAISALYYADRLNQLPLGLIGSGLGTVLLPTISRQLSSGREDEAIDTQNRGIELALFLTLPATAAFIVVAEPIVRGLFERGQFDPTDTVRTGWALAMFSLGLPAYVLIKVLTPGFYARKDTRTPVRFALISVGVNLIGNIILIPTIGVAGPPLATAIASSLNVALLYRTLRAHGHMRADTRLKHRIPRLALAAVVMGVALYFAQGWFAPYTHGSLLVTLPALGLLVASGVAVYAVACFATGAFRLADLRSLLRRKSTTA